MKPVYAIRKVLNAEFGGRLCYGQHRPEHRAVCVLELGHAVNGDLWSDTPDIWPDIRPLNDANWIKDSTRTENVIPVLEAYWNWSEWSQEAQSQVAQSVVLQTIQQLLSLLPIPSCCRRLCARSGSIAAAEHALSHASSSIESHSDYREYCHPAISRMFDALLVFCKYSGMSNVPDRSTLARTMGNCAAIIRFSEFKEDAAIVACKLWVEAAEMRYAV